MRSALPLPKLFLLGAVVMACGAVVSYLFMGDSAMDIHMHDTYYVIAHFYIIMAVAICFLIFSGVYYLIPKLCGRRLHYGLGVLHFAITLGGIVFIFWPMHYEGIAGAPRRYYDYSAWESFRQFVALNPLISVVSLLLFAGQVVFVVNVLFSLIAEKRVVRL